MNEENLRQVLGELTGRPVRRSGQNLVIHCPFEGSHADGEDRNPSCSVKIDPDGPSVYVCFACGRRGTLLGLVSIMHDGKYFERVRKLEDSSLPARIDGALERRYEKRLPQNLRIKTEKTWSETELNRFGPLDDEACRFLRARGLSSTVSFAMFSFAMFDRTEKRIVFPVRSSTGSLVGLSGRAVDQRQPKWKHYLGFKKSDFFWNEETVHVADSFLLVEGIMDALVADQAFQFVWMRNTTVLATMGTSVGVGQRKKLIEWQKPVHLMFDGDDAGELATQKWHEALDGHVPAVIDVPVPWGKDPGDMKPACIGRALHRARVRAGGGGEEA